MATASKVPRCHALTIHSGKMYKIETDDECWRDNFSE